MNKSGYGAIVWALKIGCRPCAELLAPRMSRANLDNALLFDAPPGGDARDMRFLIDHGASVNAKDTDGRTALLRAAASDVVPLGRSRGGWRQSQDHTISPDRRALRFFFAAGDVALPRGCLRQEG